MSKNVTGVAITCVVGLLALLFLVFSNEIKERLHQGTMAGFGYCLDRFSSNVLSDEHKKDICAGRHEAVILAYGVKYEGKANFDQSKFVATVRVNIPNTIVTEMEVAMVVYDAQGNEEKVTVTSRTWSLPHEKTSLAEAFWGHETMPKDVAACDEFDVHKPPSDCKSWYIANLKGIRIR